MEENWGSDLHHETTRFRLRHLDLRDQQCVVGFTGRSGMRLKLGSPVQPPTLGLVIHGHHSLRRCLSRVLHVLHTFLIMKLSMKFNYS